MAGTRRLSQLLEAIRPELRLPDGPLVVALSGGADSAALATLVLDQGRQARAAHVDHGLVHSPHMREAAVRVAGKLRLDLEVIEVEVPLGPSPEGQARSARYRALTAAIRPGEGMLTAHTAEDNLETVLINLVRGTGARGLAGIPEHRPPGIYRPMLGVGRSQAREIATLAGLGFVDDPMNLDPGLTRNYLRARVLPVLSALNPNLASAVLRMSAALRVDVDYLEARADRLPMELSPGRARSAVGDLVAAPPPLGDRALMRMLAHVCGEAGVSWERVARLRAVLRGEAASAQIFGAVAARRVGPYLEIVEEGAVMASPVDLAPGENRVGRLVFEVLKHGDVCQVAPLSRWQAIFPLETGLVASPEGVVLADGVEAWVPGVKRLPVAWYQPGTVGYLSVFAREESGWTSSP